MPRSANHRAGRRLGTWPWATWSWALSPWSLPPDSDAGGATYAMNRLVAWCAGGMRAVAGFVGGVAAFLAIAPPADITWVGPAVAVECAWGAVFAWIAFARGLRHWAVITDIVVTVGLGVAQRHLVSPTALTSGVGWVPVIGTMTIVATHLAWRAPAAGAGSAAVIGSYLVGARLAGAPGGGLFQAAVFLVQTGSMAAIMVLVRRAARDADRALAEYHEAERRARLERVRRTEDREHNRRLHDTVLATLTIIGSGGIRRDSLTLRHRAAADLGVILGFVAPRPPSPPRPRRSPAGRLDARLREAAERVAPALSVALLAPPCEVPPRVAEAFTGAVTQALHNVVRHAGVRRAEVSVREEGAGVVVEVGDAGRGFDPAGVPAHRYGVRESIVGRMRAVGGRAEISSAPGQGTRVRLSWSAPTPAVLADRRAPRA